MVDAARVGWLVLDPEAEGAGDLPGAAPADAPDWWLVAEAAAEPHSDCVGQLLAAVSDPAGSVAAAYSDFDLPDHRPVRVGGWSRERARWQDYCGSVALVRHDVLSGVSPGPGLRHRALLAATRVGEVRYLPRALYTLPADGVVPVAARDREVDLAAAGAPYSLTAGGLPRRMAAWPSVSIIIPTRGSMGARGDRNRRFLDLCLESLAATTGELEPQIVLVVDDDTDTSYAEKWRGRFGGRLVVLPYTPPFNFPDKLALGVAGSDGEIVVFLNDDVEALADGWLQELVALAAEDRVGAVGAMLLYEDGTIQHAGHCYGADGVHLVDLDGDPGTTARARSLVDRDVTGVSAACLAQRREVWTELAGMDRELPSSFNDVEYCHRIRSAGYRIVQCNSARLTHGESQTRTEGAEPWEVERLRSRIGADTMREDDPLTPCAAEPPSSGPFAVLAYRVGRARRILASSGPRALAAEMFGRGRR